MWFTVCSKSSQGSNQKDSDTARETMKSDKAALYAKRASITASLRQKKPASSVEADIASVSSLCQPQPKQEASTATSKSYTFKKGFLSDALLIMLACSCGWSPHFISFDSVEIV